MGKFYQLLYDLSVTNSCFFIQIVVSPFDYINTNDFLSKAVDYNIDGVVIQYDQAIEAAGYYSEP